jgi:3-hydroxyacyl-CoA dehydrogenase/enoyl-CoA hydratase/carnithine racemase
MSSLTNPNEVVTRSLLRFVTVPGMPRPAALITLDNGLDHRRPNTLGAGGLASLDAALDEALAAEPSFIAVTGKPYVFCVGADLTGMPLATRREQGLDIGRLGHRVFGRLHDSPVPTFAFINGAAMGGGLELALNCGYRTLSAGATALALPECSLGLVPGWGGTWLLPNLIGPAGAVKVIIENPLSQNRMLRPAEAHELGIADVLFDPADFLERSISWAADVVLGEITIDRNAVEHGTVEHGTVEHGTVERGKAWAAALARGRAVADARLHGAAPAPYRALDLLAMAETAEFAASAAAEDEAVADLVLSEELRSGLYAFDLVRRRAKRPAGAPDEAHARDVTKVGIVGAGLMASQIGLLVARRLEVPVVLTDLDSDRVDAGLRFARAEIDKMVAKGRLAPGPAAKIRTLITGAVDKEAIADADLVIEAVFEDLGVKKQVFAEVEKIVREDCVLATNTSSLSVTAMAGGLIHPERVVGLHFFNPVGLMPLVEVVRTDLTDVATLATAFAVGRQLRKSCVLVSDTPAFVVNRLLTQLMGVIFEAVDAGTPVAAAETALDPLGLPTPPFALLQLVGPAVAHHVGETLNAAYPDRFPLSRGLERLVRSGRPGVYRKDRSLDPEAVALFETGGGTPVDSERLIRTAAEALAREARLILDEGVVAEPQDIDLCMILGAGWPFHLGGITPYLDRTGTAERVTGKRFLPPGVASLPG